MKLREDINDFISTIPKNVKIVAATKYVTPLEMRDLYNVGINNFGENRVDTFLEHKSLLKDLNISWHFIGHLQRNKAHLIVNEIECLHSLDSLELAGIIDKLRSKPLDCFIEVSINEEENKNGIKLEYLYSFIEQVLKYRNINIVGLMMMAIKDSSKKSLIHQFSSLSKLKTEIEEDFNIKIPYLSMGMSDDYKEAIECGATHIRLGRILWTI